MQFDNKATRSVAEAVARILSGQPVSEELKGDQHKIDKNKNNKIDAHDFKILRGEKKVHEEKEESCEDEAEEAVEKHEKKHHGKKGEVAKHEKEMHKEEAGVSKKKEDKFHNKLDKLVHKTFGHSSDEKKMKEDVEQIQEYESKQGSYVHKGTYGYGGKGAEHGQTDYKKENEAEKEMNKKKPARKGYGARQNFVRSYAKESFSGLLDVYREGGLKSLHEALIVEEPTNDEFKAELEDQKLSMSGKKKQPHIAKPSVQAVKVVEDAEQVEERSLTEPEMKKKEEYVKGMKKSVAGFKARYGDDAKSVMYATATKMAKED